MRRGKWLPLLLLPGLLWGAWDADAGQGTADVRILIDVSGSMKHNDPKNLRRPALRLLVGLLPAESRAGVWTFGQYVNMLIPLGRVDEAWKKRARNSSGSIGSPGQFTHIEAALKRATEDWGGPPGDYRRSLILLTDGMIDVSKDKTKNAASKRRVLESLLPRLESRQVTIHTIALSKNADHELMRNLAETTGGWYEQVEDAEQLQKVFLRIFEKVGRPDTVPLKDNKFTIDASITEATVLVFHRPGAQPTEVVPPGGVAFAADSVPPNVRWHRDRGFDMLTVSEPAAGEWAIRAELDPDNRVMVVTDLKMRTSELPNRLILGQTFPFEVSFTDNGKPIRKREFLRMVAVTATGRGSTGEHEAKPLRDDGGDGDTAAGDGRFSMVFGGAFLDRGLGELVINAAGRTFTRERRFSYEVVPPVAVEATPQGEGKRLTLALTADAELVNPASLRAQAWLEDDDGAQSELPLQRGAPGKYRAGIDLMSFSGRRRVAIRADVVSLAGEALSYEESPLEVEGLGVVPAPEPALPPKPEPVQETPQPPPEPVVPDAASDGLGWGGAAIWFVAINLLLVMLAGGAFWWWRGHNPRDAVSLVEESAPDGGPGQGMEEA